MASSIRSSVVKVDEVSFSPAVDDVASILNTSDSPLVDIDRQSKTPAEFERLDEPEEEEDKEDEDEETTDKVPALPANWPRIPQIFERRNWEFSTNASPIVNKAASHLELLQSIIEEWFKAEGSRASSQAKGKVSILKTPATSAIDKGSKEKRQLRFAASGSSLSPDSRSAATLSVEGFGAFSDGHSSFSGTFLPREEITYELPYLGAEEVVEEVITLLAKLENDRQETLAGLENERKRTDMLRTKIDTICQKRMKELPMVVQKEHEACARDIAELQWHLNTSKREEERIHNRLQQAQAMQEKLQEDIQSIKDHVPLMMEKLSLEIEAMERINNAQKDTQEELQKTQARYNQVKSKYEEAQKKADEERESMKRDLTKVEDDLTKVTEDLSNAKMTYNTYVHQIIEFKQQIEDNKREKTDLEEKFEKAKAASGAIQAKVKEVEGQLETAAGSEKKLKKEYEDLTIEKEWKDKEYEKKTKKLENQREEIEDEIREYVRRNDALKMDITDKEEAIADCDKQKKKDDREMERMEKAVVQLEARYKEAMIELNEIRNLHNETKRQMDEEEARCRAEEEKLRAAAETLKRQVVEETHNKATLNARIENDSKELEKFTKLSEEQKLKTERLATEVEEQKEAVLQKVLLLRDRQAKIKDVLEKLQEKKEILDKEAEEFYETVEKKKFELEPAAKQCMEQVQEVRIELETMTQRTVEMNHEIEEKTDLSRRLQKRIEKKKVDIRTMELDNKELQTQLKEQTTYRKWVDEEYKLLQDRLKILKSSHKDYMRERKAFLEKMKVDKVKEKELNTALAKQYRQLQNAFYIIKTKLLKAIDANLKSETTVVDAKRLRMLQQHTHSAMKQYMHAQNEYSKVQIKNIEISKNASGQRLGDLQSDMDKGMDNIQSFLENQLDGDAIKKIASERVDKMERGEEVSDIASVVSESRPVTVTSVYARGT